MKVANYSGRADGVTEMPYTNNGSSSYFSSNDDDANRTGAEMLAQPVHDADLKGSVTYPMWNFRIAGVPLSVTVAFEDETWIASVDAFDVFGDGDSPKDALAELETHLENHIEFYKAQRPADLTEYAKGRRTQLMKIRVAK